MTHSIRQWKMQPHTNNKRKQATAEKSKKETKKKKATADESDSDSVKNSKRAVKKITTLDYQVWSCTFFLILRCALSEMSLLFLLHLPWQTKEDCYVCFCSLSSYALSQVLLRLVMPFVVVIIIINNVVVVAVVVSSLISFEQMHSRNSFVN